jgi:hypothetical protein
MQQRRPQRSVQQTDGSGGVAAKASRKKHLVKHSGGCHCGRVRFEVKAPAAIEAVECNCSICSKSGFLHLIVPKSRFTLIQGSESLCVYTFNTGVAKHMFCKTCGVKSFYVPRSHPDGYSVNVRCLEPATIEKITVAAFDGRNWEDHAAELGSLQT